MLSDCKSVSMFAITLKHELAAVVENSACFQYFESNISQLSQSFHLEVIIVSTLIGFHKASRKL